MVVHCCRTVPSMVTVLCRNSFGRLIRSATWAFGAPFNARVIIVLVEVAERQALELTAEFLAPELARSRAFEPLKKEASDLGRLRIGGKKDLDHSALAGHVY